MTCNREAMRSGSVKEKGGGGGGGTNSSSKGELKNNKTRVLERLRTHCFTGRGNWILEDLPTLGESLRSLK